MLNKMKKLTFDDIYLLKFAIYGGISAYDYAINSKYTFAWLILAILSVSIWLRNEIINSK
jgi:hypothetical protein